MPREKAEDVMVEQDHSLSDFINAQIHLSDAEQHSIDAATAAVVNPVRRITIGLSRDTIQEAKALARLLGGDYRAMIALGAERGIQEYVRSLRENIK